MKILINQNQYNLITEKVGVPNNIYNTATDIVYQFLNQFSKINDINNQQTFNISGNFKINDIVLNNVIINIHYKENNIITVESFYIEPQNHIIKNNIIYYDNIHLNIVLTAPQPFNHTDIYKHLINQEQALTIGFTHEIKHIYDNAVQPNKKILDTAMYSGTRELLNNTKVHTIKQFLYVLYYVNNIEGSVRASEMIADIKNKNIKQDQYQEYFNNTKIYKTLHIIKNMSFENFITNLLDEKINIQKYLAKKRIQYTNLNDAELLTTFLNEQYKDITTSIDEYISALYNVSPENNNKFYDLDKKQISKYKDNPVEYFKNSIQQSSIKANMQIRKLAKLYSML